jgi:hypothetical protein
LSCPPEAAALDKPPHRYISPEDPSSLAFVPEEPVSSVFEGILLSDLPEGEQLHNIICKLLPGLFVEDTVLAVPDLLLCSLQLALEDTYEDTTSCFR